MKNKEKNKEKNNFWKIMSGYVKDYKGHITIAIIFSMITGICVAFQPLVIKYIVDNGIGNPNLSAETKIKTVGIFCIVYIVLSAIRLLAWIIGYQSMLKSLEGSLFKLRSNFFDHVQHLCMSFYDNNSTGELYNMIMGSPMNNIKLYLQQVIMSIPYQSVAFIISVSALIYYDWLLTIILLLVAMVMVTFNYFSRPKIKKMAGEYIRAETKVSKYVTDVFHGLDAVKLYSVEDTTFEKFQKQVGEMKEEGVRVSFFQCLEHLKPEFSQYLGTAVIYFVGAISCVYRGVSIGVLYAFLSSMGIILTTLSGWLTISLQKSTAEAGLDKIMNVLNTRPTTPEAVGRRRDIDIERESAIAKNKPCIEFEDVTFGYDEKDILKNFNCKVKYNESIGLVGGSGSGKSTFTKLAIRLYDPKKGTVSLHGRNIKDFSIHDMRICFGVVPQNPFIFQSSILENIKIARPEATNKEIIKAMEMAHVHEFVNDLPLGWNTIIGDGAISLSGGQKQRIAIARAVLGNPDVLIFDEATSALDNASERLIQQSMEELMKTHTVIIVAHRLTTIRNVDRIIVFKDGEIAEEGKYDELANKDGAFKELLTFKD